MFLKRNNLKNEKAKKMFLKMLVRINSGKGEVKECWLVKFGEILLKVESDSWKLLDGLINLVILHNKQFSHDFSPFYCFSIHLCIASRILYQKQTTLLRHRVWVLWGKACHVWSRSLELDDIWSCPGLSRPLASKWASEARTDYSHGWFWPRFISLNDKQIQIEKTFCFLFGYFSLWSDDTWK